MILIEIENFTNILKFVIQCVIIIMIVPAKPLNNAQISRSFLYVREVWKK